MSSLEDGRSALNVQKVKKMHVCEILELSPRSIGFRFGVDSSQALLSLQNFPQYFHGDRVTWVS